MMGRPWRRLLGLLLLLPPVALTLWALLVSDWRDGISPFFLLFCLLPTALGLGLGLLLRLLCRDGWRWAIYVPLLLEVVPLVLAWQDLNSGGFLAGLGAAFCFMGAVCYLLGWLSAALFCPKEVSP